MYYSYVMGIDDSILSLESKGFIIDKAGKDYQVSFSEDNAKYWEDFIKKHLEVEYWNEYLTLWKNPAIITMFIILVEQ